MPFQLPLQPYMPEDEFSDILGVYGRKGGRDFLTFVDLSSGKILEETAVEGVVKMFIYYPDFNKPSKTEIYLVVSLRGFTSLEALSPKLSEAGSSSGKSVMKNITLPGEFCCGFSTPAGFVLLVGESYNGPVVLLPALSPKTSQYLRERESDVLYLGLPEFLERKVRGILTSSGLEITSLGPKHGRLVEYTFSEEIAKNRTVLEFERREKLFFERPELYRYDELAEERRRDIEGTGHVPYNCIECGTSTEPNGKAYVCSVPQYSFFLTAGGRLLSGEEAYSAGLDVPPAAYSSAQMPGNPLGAAYFLNIREEGADVYTSIFERSRFATVLLPWKDYAISGTGCKESCDSAKLWVIKPRGEKLELLESIVLPKYTYVEPVGFLPREYAQEFL